MPRIIPLTDLKSNRFADKRRYSGFDAANTLDDRGERLREWSYFRRHRHRYAAAICDNSCRPGKQNPSPLLERREGSRGTSGPRSILLTAALDTLGDRLVGFLVVRNVDFR